VPAVVDLDFLPDMGRITLQLLSVEIILTFELCAVHNADMQLNAALHCVFGMDELRII
jgi:hypothetical protein